MSWGSPGVKPYSLCHYEYFETSPLHVTPHKMLIIPLPVNPLRIALHHALPYDW